MLKPTKIEKIPQGRKASSLFVRKGGIKAGNGSGSELLIHRSAILELNIAMVFRASKWPDRFR